MMQFLKLLFQISDNPRTPLSCAKAKVVSSGTETSKIGLFCSSTLREALDKLYFSRKPTISLRDASCVVNLIESHGTKNLSAPGKSIAGVTPKLPGGEWLQRESAEETQNANVTVISSAKRLRSISLNFNALTKFKSSPICSSVSSVEILEVADFALLPIGKAKYLASAHTKAMSWVKNVFEKKSRSVNSFLTFLCYFKTIPNPHPPARGACSLYFSLTSADIILLYHEKFKNTLNLGKFFGNIFCKGRLMFWGEYNVW